MQLHPQYYYQQLPPPERAAYHGMLTCLRELAPSARIPRLTMETLGTLFFQLRLDHPEIFWATSFKYKFFKGSPNYIFIPEYIFPAAAGSPGDFLRRRLFVPRRARGGVCGLLPRVSV